MAGSTLLYSEILDKVHKAKNKDQKVMILKQNDSEGLRMVIKSSFDPKIEWSMPEGEVPFKPNDVPMGTEHTVLAMEAKKLWHFIKGADNQTPQHKKETMISQEVAATELPEGPTRGDHPRDPAEDIPYPREG